ncbi:MAG: pilin [Candidatus Uhrbacteria bacterium]|nr:pilin [Candidatus Uhrbacteria bacterium]
MTANQQIIRDTLNNTGTLSGYANKTLPDAVGNVIYAAISILGVVLIILIVYAGFKWMLAQGEEQKTKEALSLITNSIIGLIIVLAAYAISYFVISSLKGGV